MQSFVYHEGSINGSRTNSSQSDDQATKMVLLYVLLTIVFLSCWLLLLPFTWSLRNRRLPPGPWRWPLVGNIPHLSMTRPHEDLAKLAHVYGPLLSINLGQQLVIVATSPTANTEILKAHDRILGARSVPDTFQVANYLDYSLPWAVECDERWKRLRSICKTEIVSVKALELHSQMREEKISQLVRFISRRPGEEIKIMGLFYKTVFNILANVFFSRDVFDLEKDSEGLVPKGLISRVMEVGLAPNVADYYPALGKFDIQGLRKEMIETMEKLFGIWDTFIEERKQEGGSNSKQDILSMLISIGFTNIQMKTFFMDMFIAGTDTSITTTEWVMSELMRNPEAMARVRKEVESVVGHRRNGDTMVKDVHLVHFKYLQACIKETLRLHPVGAFLLPRIALEDCNVMNYLIPKGSRVLVNVWAVGRDPAVWTDPNKFQPDRFLDVGLDDTGNDLKFTPFGGGRRICPGVGLANRLMLLILASLIHNFHWSLPNGMKPEELDMRDTFGITLEKEQPLVIIPTPV